MFIKVNKRKLPVRFESTVLSSKTDVLMIESNLSKFPESEAMIKMVRKVEFKKASRLKSK